MLVKVVKKAGPTAAVSQNTLLEGLGMGEGEAPTQINNLQTGACSSSMEDRG